MDFTQEAIDKHIKECARVRSTLAEGPWKHELDYELFEAHGFNCLISRNPSLFFWCGYVGIPKSHPDHGKERDEFDDIMVHGGITYAEHCQRHICHIPKPGEADHLFWIGFDCGHSFDLAPGYTSSLIPADLRKSMTGENRTYRTYEYAKAETIKLARQLQNGN
jgi:hypothetical protein